MSWALKTICALLLAAVAAGCASYKPPTKEELALYGNIPEMVRSRPQGKMSGYTTALLPDRFVVGFKISTTKEELLVQKRRIVADLFVYCDYHGGELKDLKEENEIRFEELKKQHAYEEESKDEFECGPRGRGKRYTDPQRFNPAKCRKIKEKKIDMAKVHSDYGNPASFACFKLAPRGLGILFMGYMKEDGTGEEMSVAVRVNEAKRMLLPLSDKRNMK